MAIIILQATILSFYRKRIPNMRFTKEERKEIAFLTANMPKASMERLVTEVKPDTIKRWFRELHGKQYDSSKMRRPKADKKKGGRPLLKEEFEKFVLRIIREHPTLGDQSIADIVKRTHGQGSSSTIQRIRKHHGIPPSRERKSSWHRVKDSKHTWGMDFFTIGTFSNEGLKTLFVLIFVHWSSRKLIIGGATEYPNSNWVCRVIRDLDFEDVFQYGKRMVHDNDPIFNDDVDDQLNSTGLEVVKTAVHAPMMNSKTERCVRTIREAFGHQRVFSSVQTFMSQLRDFVTFYNTERHHQGLECNVIPFPCEVSKNTSGQITQITRCGDRLGFYYRKSA